MKKTLHVGLVTALLIAFGQAPLEHTHEGEDHHGQGLHAHGFHASANGQAWEEVDDDDVQMREWVTEGGPEAVQLSPALPEHGVESQLVSRMERLRQERLRNHDPPPCTSLSTRGPPQLTLLTA